MEGKIIEAILRPNVCANVYAVVAPQYVSGSYIVYDIVDRIPWDTKDGVADMDEVRIQLNIFGDSYATVATLVESVRTALDHVTGTYDGIVVHSMWMVDENTLYDEEMKKKGKALDFKIIRER